jgi:hypothetical protein
VMADAMEKLDSALLVRMASRAMCVMNCVRHPTLEQGARLLAVLTVQIRHATMSVELAIVVFQACKGHSVIEHSLLSQHQITAQV